MATGSEIIEKENFSVISEMLLLSTKREKDPMKSIQFLPKIVPGVGGVGWVVHARVGVGWGGSCKDGVGWVM